MEIVTQETGEVKKVTYKDFETAMDSEMSKEAEGFVRIGYLFKMARDTDVLRESGYSSYLEFAQKNIHWTNLRYRGLSISTRNFPIRRTRPD